MTEGGNGGPPVTATVDEDDLAERIPDMIRGLAVRFRDAEDRDARERARRQMRSLLAYLAAMPTGEDRKKAEAVRAAGLGRDDRYAMGAIGDFGGGGREDADPEI